MAMRIAAAATILAATSAAAFTIQTNPNSPLTQRFNDVTTKSSTLLFSTTATESPCDIPEDVIPNDLTAQKGSASLLRSSVLTNVDGDYVSLGSLMGNEKSVVVFLRHMGWPYCWTYANDWVAVQQQLKDEGIAGPIFISIGDNEKLQTFLDQNPNISKDQMFVDDYNFDAYKAVGFKSFLETDKEAVKDVKMSAPNLSFKQWMSYAGNVGKVSPIPKDMKFGDVPEGVLRLGGTFVISGDDVVYQWSDRIPGDHPDIDEVVTIAQEAQVKTGDKIKGLFNKFRS